MNSDQVVEKPVPNWALSFPIPKSTPPSIEPEELAELIRTSQAGKDFVIVDVRRTDFENAFIQTAINLPAQSFYPTLPSLLSVFRSIPTVVFYCNSCTPGGRGPRTAAWYQDALDASGIKSSQAMILAGGVKGWIGHYKENASLTVKLP